MKYSMGLRYWRRAGVIPLTGIATIGITGIIGFSDLCEAQTARKSQEIYRNSFSKPEVFVDESIPDSMKGEKDTVEVPSLNSFPLRVQVAESNVTGWLQPDSVVQPKKISKNFIRFNWNLSNIWNTIHIIRNINTMPMNCCIFS